MPLAVLSKSRLQKKQPAESFSCVFPCISCRMKWQLWCMHAKVGHQSVLSSYSTTELTLDLVTRCVHVELLSPVASLVVLMQLLFTSHHVSTCIHLYSLSTLALIIRVITQLKTIIKTEKYGNKVVGPSSKAQYFHSHTENYAYSPPFYKPVTKKPNNLLNLYHAYSLVCISCRMEWQLWCMHAKGRHQRVLSSYSTTELTLDLVTRCVHVELLSPVASLVLMQLPCTSHHFSTYVHSSILFVYTGTDHTSDHAT